ncbi:TPA: zinc finger-like domain-containing protein [Citrobacter freundii]|uniref:hypothetical protein n=1 Tax=Citrobacter freundii TaxID=546 RepID=UPI001FF399AF|nr:hypothetical protein [Citrobacter freundii]MCJ8533750.1 hypothetical protein [Citrobacter freundii]MDT7090252.1 hypothetical protein [Citrobacter freundii]HED2900169.1 zinc finger-like domain-containing protein [Citrobacter freundii]HED3072462.1 zinc finger-like domain-containing protein [Citrobacter freundii]HED3601712.1 zinc finger-like domain-containing protein [Citrobacter freundii]
MTTNNHPAHGPVSLDRLHQISEILSKAAAQSDGGNLGYAMADAVKVIDEVLNAEPVAYWRYAFRADGFCYADGINSKKHHDAHPLSQLSEGDYWRVTPLYTTPPAPVVPDGYCIMPVALTAKNGAKWALSGEFSTAREVTCPECEGDGCSDCDGRGDWYEDQAIDWTTIKEIYRRAVEVCALPTGQTQDKIA